MATTRPFREAGGGSSASRSGYTIDTTKLYDRIRLGLEELGARLYGDDITGRDMDELQWLVERIQDDAGERLRAWATEALQARHAAAATSPGRAYDVPRSG